MSKQLSLSLGEFRVSYLHFGPHNTILVFSYKVHHFCIVANICYIYICFFTLGGTSLVAQTVKHLPIMWETRLQSLGWEDLLEKEMATHSCILAWETPWMEEPGRLQSMGYRESDMTEQLHFDFGIALCIIY